MPDANVNWLHHSEILSFEEMLRISALMAELGIKKIKVTGGEPLARRGVIPFIERLTKISGIEKVSLTTNAIFLDDHLSSLILAGISAINISLDTLNEETFRRITRTNAFAKVCNGLAAALDAGIQVKINCVPISGYNNTDIIQIAKLAEKNSVHVRFIELMPLGFACELNPISPGEIFMMLEKEFGKLLVCNDKLGAGPAEYFNISGFSGKIGFISALTHTFCALCNRVRLTSAGMLKPCLASDINIDIKSMLRGGAGDFEIKDAIKKIIFEKPPAHNFTADNKIHADVHKRRFMYRIGG
jgi:cyclic pyranopterin phosphate synthase